MTTVLVAEDNLTLLEDIVFELEHSGYEVISASDGQVVLDILATCDQLPDIIVSDIAMPNIDGFKLLEHLRNEPAWNGIPFLFLTAFDSPNSKRISKELGADDYIVKPFKGDDLVIAMENKLKRIAAFREQSEKHLNDVRRTLLNLISHELRTPLTSIYGGSELLAASLEDVPDETVHRMVDLIRNGAKRMNRLTDNTITLLQIDGGQMESTFKQYRQVHPVSDLVKAAIASIENENPAALSKTSISIMEQPEPLYVEGVFEYLVMMIAEPLRNALAFSPKDSTIEVNVSNNGDHVEIVIQDHGLGIAKEDLPLVWERFVQIDREQYEQQGAGLGLAIVRDTARIHGGTCTITSEPGTGTCFTLILPAASEAQNGQQPT